MTQKKLILKYLEDFGSITTFQAFADLGITRLAARIADLKKEGYKFEIEKYKHITRYGKPTYLARYRFKEKK